MSAFGQFMKLFSMAGGVRGTTNPNGGIESLTVAGNKFLTAQMLVRSLLPQSVGASANKAVFAAAVSANAAKVAYVGHSIANGNNQNYYGATVYSGLRSVLKEAFPSVVFTFENYGIGGTQADDFLGNPNTTVAAPSNNVYREFWQNDSGAITSAAAWANKVAAFLPDLIVMQWDLNETDPAAFATSIQSIIDDINANARWSAKRPSIVLAASHTGIANQSVVRNCHKCLRALARKNKLPLIDAGRIYDILTTGVDPVNIIPSVSGEIAWGGRLRAASALPAEFYESKIGVAYSPTGTNIRDQSSGASLRFYRSALSADGANQIEIATNTVSAVVSVFYRANPLDANYATGTGAQYEIRITGTAVQAYYWPAGSAVAISGAAVTLTNGTGTNAKFQIRAEYKGAAHKVTICAPTGEVKQFEFFDYQRLESGYNGWGYSGTSGGQLSVGLVGNVSAGQVLEFWSAQDFGAAILPDSALLGAVNDWSSNYTSAGGNAINHPSNAGYKLIYEHAFYDVARQLQA